MAVLEVKEINEGREASENEKGERTYVRLFGVITSSATDGAVQVKQATGIPRVYDVYTTSSEQDLGAYAKKVIPQVTDNPKHWHVRVEYDSSFEQEEENPLDRAAQYTWGFAQFQKVAWKDVDGKGIVNSAGDPFEPPPEIDDSRPVLSIVRNEAAFNPSLAIDYQDAVNSDAFLGFEAGQVKVANITAVSRFENNVRYWEVTYEFHFRREGWTLGVMDVGRFSTGHVPLWNKDESGQEILGDQVTQDIPLDGSGERLPDPTGPDNVVFRDFTVYKQRTFTVFIF